MKYLLPSDHLLVLGILLVGLVVLWMTGVFKTREGFQTTTIFRSPTCPGGYTFFNDTKGSSFCCRNTANGDSQVNAYTHQCMAVGPTDLCAFSSTERDPRTRDGRYLPSCSSLKETLFTTAMEGQCPSVFPHFAIGDTSSRCCQSGLNDDGTACAPIDQANKKRYCVASGARAADELDCAQMRLYETVKCPTEDFIKIDYALGTREATKYGNKVAGLTLPVCFQMDSTCIPDEVIDFAKDRGAYTDKDPKNWKWSCSAWKRVNQQRDFTFQPVEEYL